MMDRADRNGFTLIELMVALAVFAVAALALMRLETVSLAQTADLDQRFLREVVASNLAAQTLTDPASPPLGSADGTVTNMGRSFAWQRDVRADGRVGVLEISVTVRETTRGAVTTPLTLRFSRLPGA